MTKKVPPRSYDPGPKHPREYLAYLNRAEMELLRRATDGKVGRGPHGLPSFYVEGNWNMGGDATGGGGSTSSTGGTATDATGGSTTLSTTATPTATTTTTAPATGSLESAVAGAVADAISSWAAQQASLSGFAPVGQTPISTTSSTSVQTGQPTMTGAVTGEEGFYGPRIGASPSSTMSGMDTMTNMAMADAPINTFGSTATQSMYTGASAPASPKTITDRVGGYSTLGYANPLPGVTAAAQPLTGSLAGLNAPGFPGATTPRPSYASGAGNAYLGGPMTLGGQPTYSPGQSMVTPGPAGSMAADPAMSDFTLAQSLNVPTLANPYDNIFDPGRIPGTVPPTAPNLGYANPLPGVTAYARPLTGALAGLSSPTYPSSAVQMAANSAMANPVEVSGLSGPAMVGGTPITYDRQGFTDIPQSPPTERIVSIDPVFGPGPLLGQSIMAPPMSRPGALATMDANWNPNLLGTVPPAAPVAGPILGAGLSSPMVPGPSMMGGPVTSGSAGPMTPSVYDQSPVQQGASENPVQGYSSNPTQTGFSNWNKYGSGDSSMQMAKGFANWRFGEGGDLRYLEDRKNSDDEKKKKKDGDGNRFKREYPYNPWDALHWYYPNYTLYNPPKPYVVNS